MKAPLDAKSYAGRDPDETEWATLKSTLLGETEARRRDFLCDILTAQEKARLGTRPWFELAKSVLHGKASFEMLLVRGLVVADASTILNWLECCVPRLGLRSTIRILERESELRPERTALAEYWLSRFARTDGDRDLVTKFLQAPERVARRQQRSGPHD